MIIILTPGSRVLLEKLTGFKPVKKLPVFHVTRSFITSFTSARHFTPSWARSIQSMFPHPTSWRSILILSSHLRLELFQQWLRKLRFDIVQCSMILGKGFSRNIYIAPTVVTVCPNAATIRRPQLTTALIWTSSVTNRNVVNLHRLSSRFYMEYCIALFGYGTVRHAQPLCGGFCTILACKWCVSV